MEEPKKPKPKKRLAKKKKPHKAVEVIGAVRDAVVAGLAAYKLAKPMLRKLRAASKKKK
jgi:hypothetical protein